MPLDRTDLRRWKHTLDYFKDRYGKDCTCWRNSTSLKTSPTRWAGISSITRWAVQMCIENDYLHKGEFGMKRNNSRAFCRVCRRLIQKGEGIGHTYTMHDKQAYYYLCPGCDRKRAEVDKTLHTLISKKGE